MTICFITTQPEICQIFQKKLQNHYCFIFSETTQALEVLKGSPELCQIIIADYMIFNHDFFNLKEELLELKIHTPLIFYNSPVPFMGSRLLEWEAEINTENLNIENYSEIFTTLLNLVESPELSPYIALMQKPLPLPREKLINYIYEDFIVENLEAKLYKCKSLPKMTDGLFFLLETIYKNNCKASYNQIIDEYKKNGKEISIKSLEVEISRLKKILENNSFTKLLILKRKENVEIIEIR